MSTVINKTEKNVNFLFKQDCVLMNICLWNLPVSSDVDFYKNTQRITVVPNYKNIFESYIVFEGKDEDGFHYPLEKIKLKKEKNKLGICFNSIPMIMQDYPEEKKIVIYEKVLLSNMQDFSSMHQEDLLNLDSFEVFLRNILQIKHEEVIRFEKVLQQNNIKL